MPDEHRGGTACIKETRGVQHRFDFVSSDCRAVSITGATVTHARQVVGGHTVSLREKRRDETPPVRMSAAAMKE